LPSAVQFEGLGLLRCMRMLGAGVDLELLEQAAAQLVLRKHPAHGGSDDLLGLLRQHLACGGLLHPPGVNEDMDIAAVVTSLREANQEEGAATKSRVAATVRGNQPGPALPTKTCGKERWSVKWLRHRSAKKGHPAPQNLPSFLVRTLRNNRHHVLMLQKLQAHPGVLPAHT